MAAATLVYRPCAPLADFGPRDRSSAGRSEQQLGAPTVQLHAAKLVEAEEVEAAVAGDDAAEAPLVSRLHRSLTS